MTSKPPSLRFAHPPALTPNARISTAHDHGMVFAIEPLQTGWHAWVSDLHDTDAHRTRDLGTHPSFDAARAACESVDAELRSVPVDASQGR